MSWPRRPLPRDLIREPSHLCSSKGIQRAWGMYSTSTSYSAMISPHVTKESHDRIRGSENRKEKNQSVCQEQVCLLDYPDAPLKSGSLPLSSLRLLTQVANTLPPLSNLLRRHPEPLTVTGPSLLSTPRTRICCRTYPWGSCRTFLRGSSVLYAYPPNVQRTVDLHLQNTRYYALSR